MRVLVPLTVVLPLLGAGLSLALSRWDRAQTVLSVVTLGAHLAICVAILVAVRDGGLAVVNEGAWPAPVGITLVVDLFSALMLVTSSFMLLAVLVYANGNPVTHDRRFKFHPVYLVLTAGVSAALITGDLFNLFVAFEIMLASSYVLITLGGRRDQVRAGMTYVVVNLLASLLFLTVVAFCYAATGTVNMAQLAERLVDVPDWLRSALGLLLLVVFGIKAAIFPLFFWLPDSYPTAPTPVTAIFAGLLTKVGVYAIIRTQTLLFAPEIGDSSVLLWLAAATMIVGGLGAIAQDDMKRILSFHIVGQIGYMIFGLALYTIAGIAGAIFYVVHQIIVKTALFLTTGLVEHTAGTGALHRVNGILHRAPVIAALFALPAMSLAGFPPFSGFVGKLALVEAGIGAGAYVLVGIGLVGSALTLFSMTKIWAGAFWGRPEGLPGTALAVAAEHDTDAPAVRAPRSMTFATVTVVACSLAVAVAAGPIFELCEQASAQLADRAGYVSAVLSP